MAKGKETTAQDTTESNYLDFQLELPSALDVKPDWTVLLPRNKEARIYTVQRQRFERNGYEATSHSVLEFDMYVVSRTTGSTGNQDSYHSGVRSFQDKPALKQALIDTARFLARKRTTRKQVSVVDVHDNGDDD